MPLHDRAQVGEGMIELVVDDDVVEFRMVSHVVHGIAQAPRDHLIAIGPSTAQSLGQRLPRGRQDEDAVTAFAASLRVAANLCGALPVDLEDDIVAFAKGSRQRFPARAVVMIEHPCMLEKAVFGDHGFETRHVNEMIIPAINFIGSLRASRVRDAHSEIRLLLKQRLDQTGFARARGCGNDKQSSSRHLHLIQCFALARAFFLSRLSCPRPCGSNRFPATWTRTYWLRD